MKSWTYIKEFLKGERCATPGCGHKESNHRPECDEVAHGCTCKRFIVYQDLKSHFPAFMIIAAFVLGLIIGIIF